MTTAAQSGRERLRWDEFLPVRGKWAWRLLLLPILLLLLLMFWVDRGVHIELPGWFSFEAESCYWPEMGTPMPPEDYLLVGSSAFARWGWGRRRERIFSLGAMRYCVTTWSRISDEEAQRRGLPVE